METNNAVDQLFSAVKNSDADTLKSLIKSGVDIKSVDETRKTPLHYAKSPSVVKILFNRGADANATDTHGRTALYYAESPSVAKLLLKHDANINTVDIHGQTPLHHAHGAVAGVFIARGMDVNAVDEQGRTALHYAEDPDMVKLLLDHGADPSITDKDGYTALGLVDSNKQDLIDAHVNYKKEGF